MKQVVQNIRSGVTSVKDVPAPVTGDRDVLVQVCASLVSAGTERYVVDLAKSSLVQKALKRPDHVKRVLQKVRQEGLRSTITQVGAKLDEPMALGYSAAGIVLDAGDAIRAFQPGDRVAVVAPHAGIVAASGTQCARIPAAVPFDRAAYAGVGAIGLQGVRLARVSLGERVLVIGLGLIGLMTAAMLKAQGCKVFGVEPDADRLDLARHFGVEVMSTSADLDRVKMFSGDAGVDAVVITAATSSNEPIEFAASACRPKGRIVLVGVTGLNIPRQPFFEKELEFTVSSSLGPGRGDASYEGKGRDYPIGHVRWTMQRNLEAVLDLIAAGALPVERLTTHRFAIDDAARAYDLLSSRTEKYLGIVLEYPREPAAAPARVVSSVSPKPAAPGTLGISVVGAGNFSRLVMLPILRQMQDVSFRGVCTGKGLTATSVADGTGFEFATTDFDEVLKDPKTDAVFVLTRHHLHGRQVAAALAAGKHVFVEKPLNLTRHELVEIEQALSSTDRMLMVGFNRRFARATGALLAHFRSVDAPLTVSYRFAAPAIPADAWPQDLETGGGRLIGEACHAIDMCVALTGSPIVRVFAEAVGPAASPTRDDRVVLSMRHENGAVSSVVYQAAGDPAGPKERIEVFAPGRTAIVDDWDHVETWSGGRVSRARAGGDKGHAQELRAFVAACRSGGGWPISWDHLRSASWAAIAAMESLKTGLPIDPDTPFG